MTIRRTLLFAFLLVGMLPSIVLTYLAYAQVRNALQREISVSLQAQALTLATDINQILFERLQNALSWNHVDVMQDILAKDVDKRVSQFLSEAKSAYGDIYESIYCIDLRGRVIASSDAAMIGQQAPPERLWTVVTLPNGQVRLDQPAIERASGQYHIPIRVPVLSTSSNKAIGSLVLVFNADGINRILETAGAKGRSAVLLDAGNRVIGATQELRKRNIILSKAPSNWLVHRPTDGALPIDDADTYFSGPIAIATNIAGSKQNLSNLQLKTLVLQPVSIALSPVYVMRLTFIGLLFATLLLVAVVAILVAGRIAQPIVSLTAFTRKYSFNSRTPRPILEMQGEVAELARAFFKAMDDLDRSRQDFLRASKLAVAGEIAATMAHEIRTPLGILRSSAQVLRQEPLLSAEGQEIVSYIESETERINRLMTSVLESAQPHSPVVEFRNVSSILHACVVMLGSQAERKNIVVLESSEDDNISVNCDAEQLTQVILNLLLNAIQLTPVNGCICAECKDAADGIEIIISDSGPGISEEDRHLIFEPFISKRAGGIGLGLSVVKQIVLAHNGSISIGESSFGGAEFTIYIPRNLQI